MIDEMSSNYKETTNLVFNLKRMINNEGSFERGSKVFLVMDHDVAEQTYFRG